MVGPYTVLKNTPLPEAIGNQVTLINVLQRITGLTAFTLLIFQIILGALMSKFIDKLGGWIFNFHKVEGLVIWGFIFLHPLLFITARYFQFGLSEALLAIVPSVSTYTQKLYSLGKLAFIFVSIGVLSGYFRDKPLIRKSWKYLHLLNYVAFTIVALHTYLLGTDAFRPPFLWLYWVSISLVVGLVIFRVIKLRNISG